MMSLYNRDEGFIHALKKNPKQRTEKDLEVIYSRLHHFEALSNLREHTLRTYSREVRYEWHDANEILYGKEDYCKCWYILLSGSIFIQGSMFLRNTSFGKSVPGSTRRGNQCLVLEPSEMIAIDYPDMHPGLHTGAGTRIKRNPSTSSRSTLDSVVEVDSHSSSAESSPSQSVSRKTGQKMANGQAVSIPPEDNLDIINDPQQYYPDQDDAVSRDDPEQDEQVSDDEEQDSISLHSTSSSVKDQVTEVLKKEVQDRNEDDHEVLLEFTRNLRSFSNMTEPIRKELCKVMIFVQIEKAGQILLKDDENLDSWSVIINGEVQNTLPNGEKTTYYMGESFGVTPSMQQQSHKGILTTLTDDCQFVCVAQAEYCQILHKGQENMENVFAEDGKLEMVKEKREIEGGKKGHIVIRGTSESLRLHLLEENSIDTTFAEDFLLTYRAFYNNPETICSKLLELFDREEYKSKVTRVILLWVNNHFNDFECNRSMMELLEKFEEKLQKCNKTGECRLFNIACSTKAKSRVLQLSRTSNEEDLNFSITGGTEGYPIYILQVSSGSKAEEKGLKRGDQLLNVNGQNFEKLNMEKANTILRKNTDLTLTVKTNLFAFKEMMTDLKNPQRKKEKKHRKKSELPVIAQINTMQPLRNSRTPSDASEYDGKPRKEVPEDVIKVFRADQSYRFIFVNQDTTAEEAVRNACKEFGIVENVKNYSLCRVTVQNESFVKQSKLPDKLSNLKEIPLSARYYLKNNMESEQLLPDENIQDLLKEANYTFLDLDCFEVALYLTLQDYDLFKTVEQTDFIDDLFHLNEVNLCKFKAFEDLVNRELFWVVSTMCAEPNVIRRSKTIKHFTKIAQHCKVLKNLNSTFAIISGLGYRAVSRMKATWEKVPAKCQRTFEDLQSLMDPSRNMSKYRTLLNEMTSQPPVIPYIPVVKKDLTFLHLGNDTMVDNLVNFEKMRMIGREVRNVCRLCSADSSQVITSAAAHQHESDRPSSNIYHTLTRRGRRSSFNNARKMYEDSVIQRRVKQYMQQLKIESDEDKLMELSKQVEPQVANSGQPKRRTNAGANDSPSRSSKTLPAGKSNVVHARNNSEPQLNMGHGLSLQPTRKKQPTSSLPKFGTTSPQAIRKLLALSEESGDSGSSGSSKHGSLEQRRSGSNSSRELSPTTSPYLSPKRDIMRSKGSISSIDSAHSIGHENTNRNNNRGHRQDFNHRASYPSKRFSHPVALLSNAASFLNPPRITSSQSNNSLSPHTSPNRMLPGEKCLRNKPRNSPVRSNSSSSTDTVKSGGGRSTGERPVIIQNRSGSFGALSVTTIASDRRAAAAAQERRNLNSSSSPSLMARANASHHHLILPNHPQIPRSPSMDSGVVSMGSLSADSTRFLNSEAGDIFTRHVHQSNSSLSSVEGYHSQQSLQQIPAQNTNQQSPVVRRHIQNLHAKHDKMNKTKSLDGGEGTSAPQIQPGVHSRKSMPPRANSEAQSSKTEDKNDDIKQTFLSGSRGWGDASQKDKDPWPTAAKLAPGMPSAPADPAGWMPGPPGDNLIAVGDLRTHSPGSHSMSEYHSHSQKSGEFKGGGDVIDGSYHRKVAVSGSGPEIQQYYERLKAQERPNPPASLNFQMTPPPHIPEGRTPDGVLEERHIMEHPQHRQRLNKSFDSSTPYSPGGRYNHPAALCERHSMSYAGMPTQYYDGPGTPTTNLPPMQYPNMGKSDPGMRHPRESPSEYPNYSFPGNFCNKPGCKCPASRLNNAPPRHLDYTNFVPPARTSSPKQQGDARAPMSLTTDPDNVFISDFGNPNPRTFVRSSALHDSRGPHPNEMRSPNSETGYPPLSTKHSNPNVQANQYSHMGLPYQGVSGGMGSALNPLRNPHETPHSHHHRGNPRFTSAPYDTEYTPPGNRFSNSRSTSDVSLNSTDLYNNYDHVAYNNSMNKMQSAQYQGPPGNVPYPSPIDGNMDSPQYKSPYYRDSQGVSHSPANLSRHSKGTPGSTPKSHQSVGRTKSSEWGVTDLDKENQQQTMQVWSSGSSSNANAKNAKDGSSPTKNNDTPAQDQMSRLKTTPKRKKPPPPLPPQRTSSFGTNHNISRLSSGTLSPLSSPPTSPTTPVPITKLTLNESHPQLVVKTKGDTMIPVPATTAGKPLSQANGVLPHSTSNSMVGKPTHTDPTSKQRMLPSYNQATHNKSLPSYQNYQDSRENPEQISQV